MITFLKLIKCFGFLINILYITFSESLLYILFCDFDSFIERVALRLASVNILYVKIFQAVAFNNNFIGEKTNNTLIQFADNAPWTCNDIRFEELIDITECYNLRLENGFENPINAGMISIVYKAINKQTNEIVIIKMKRENIEEKLHDAIEILLVFIHLLNFIPIINKYQISETICRNIDMITKQTNFMEEVENTMCVKENCKNLKYIKIPNVFKEATQNFPNFIIMEYIEGKKINEISTEDYGAFACQVIKFGMVTTLIHGVTHGDLHGGNILFIKDEKDEKYPHKIGVIDFGIIHNIDTTYQKELFNMSIRFFKLSTIEIADGLSRCNLIEPKDIIDIIPKEHYNAIIKMVAEMVDDAIYITKKINQQKIYKFLFEFNKYISQHQLHKYGLRLSDSFVKTQVSFAMAHGVTLTLCKENIVAVFEKSLNDLFHIDLFQESIEGIEYNEDIEDLE